MKDIPNKIFLIVPEISFFMSHRFELVKNLTQNGYRVKVITAFDNDEMLPSIKGLSFKFLDSRRATFGVFKLLETALLLRKLIKSEDPYFIYAISHRSILLSIFATLFMNQKLILAISGMGSLFSPSSSPQVNRIKYLLTGKILISFYKLFIPKKRAYFILQNKEDYEYIVKNNLAFEKSSFIISGNGLKKSFFFYDPLPSIQKKIRFIMIARLLKDKGVLEFLKASHELSLELEGFESMLFGDFDPANFNSLTPNELKPFLNTVVQYKGHTRKIRDEIINAAVVVHPSYREGFSKVLMESQACSRPIITTNVVGCKDVIIPNKTGILVEPHSYIAVKEAMKEIIAGGIDLNLFSKRAYEHAVNKFSVELASAKHIEIFRKIQLMN